MQSCLRQAVARQVDLWEEHWEVGFPGCQTPSADQMAMLVARLLRGGSSIAVVSDLVSLVRDLVTQARLSADL